MVHKETMIHNPECCNQPQHYMTSGTSIMLPKQPMVFWIICVPVNCISLQFSIWSVTAAKKMTWYDNSSTCSLEISTQLQPLPDTALRMRRECFLNIVHLNPAWQISALPEQAIYEHLHWTQSITTVSCACHRFVTGISNNIYTTGVCFLERANPTPKASRPAVMPTQPPN